jgi:hypothetical protein
MQQVNNPHSNSTSAPAARASLTHQGSAPLPFSSHVLCQGCSNTLTVRQCLACSPAACHRAAPELAVSTAAAHPRQHHNIRVSTLLSATRHSAAKSSPSACHRAAFVSAVCTPEEQSVGRSCCCPLLSAQGALGAQASAHQHTQQKATGKP